MAIAWVLFTIMAAFMQAWRNAFQKQLSTTVDVYGTTLARFLFSPVFAFGYLAFLYQQQPITAVVSFSPHFWLYIVIAGISQIYATALMVKLFQQKNYAIGIGLAKSEAILAALIGEWVMFCDHFFIGTGSQLRAWHAAFFTSCCMGAVYFNQLPMCDYAAVLGFI